MLTYNKLLCIIFIGEYMNDLKFIVAERIKKVRHLCKVSQNQLAKLLNLSPSRISAWETMKSLPKIKYLLMFCKIFCVSMDYMLGLCDESYRL